jgi:hypothetical protein
LNSCGWKIRKKRQQDAALKTAALHLNLCHAAWKLCGGFPEQRRDAGLKARRCEAGRVAFKPFPDNVDESWKK